MIIKDIARLAGVPISIISKIVNSEDENINVEIRNRASEIVKDYNYVPYGSVKSTSEVRTFILGLLIPSLSRMNLPLNGIVSVVQEHDYSIMIYESGTDPVNELKNIPSLYKNNVGGITWEPVYAQGLDNRHYFKEQNIKICLIDSDEEQNSYFIDFTEIRY